MTGRRLMSRSSVVGYPGSKTNEASWVIIPTLTPRKWKIGPHPLRVAPREVVVDGDDVDAAARHRVEHGGERRDQRLALAGAHLRDATLVEDDAADELDVEVAHAERSLHGLAGHREDLRHHVIERLLDALVLALAARLGELAPTLEIRVFELVLGRFVGLGDLADLVADLREPCADLLLGERLYSASRAFAASTTGWRRRISRSFESTKRERNFMGR